MKLIRKWWIFVVVVAIGLFIRTYKLADVPASLYYDEIDLGYQVRSLVETGKDYRGSLSPFFVRSFNTDKTPLPVLLSIPGIIFTDPKIQVRVMTALAGTVVTLLAGVFAFMLTKNKLAAIVVAFVFATNPWQIQFSRIAFEAIWVLVFYFAFLIFLVKWYKQKKLRDYYLWITFLSLGVYVYRIMSFYVPVTFAILGVVFFRELWNLRWKHLVGGAFLAAIIILPFLYATTIASADQTRIEQISITSDPLVPIFVLRNREIDSGDYKDDVVGRQAVKSSFAFHNKLESWIGLFKNNYLKAFSSEFLFIEGDLNLRQGVSGVGELLVIDVIGLIAGLWYVGKRIKDKLFVLLVAWFLTGPFPADLTIDGAWHASRLIIFSGPLLLILGLGWWQVLLFLSQRKWRAITIGGLTILWLAIFSNFAHKYLVHFPLESARWHGYGFEQAVGKVMELDGKYKKVIMTNSYEPPILHYMFWANVAPSEIQDYGPEFAPEVILGKRFDKYKSMNWSKVTEGFRAPEEIGLAMQPDTLYLVTQDDIGVDWRVLPPPKGVKVEAIIPFPDNTRVAFYLIAKDTEAFKSTNR